VGSPFHPNIACFSNPSEEMSNFSKLVLGWQVCQIQSTTYGHDGQTNPNFV
jgi:hypothetical protein